MRIKTTPYQKSSECMRQAEFCRSCERWLLANSQRLACGFQSHQVVKIGQCGFPRSFDLLSHRVLTRICVPMLWTTGVRSDVLAGSGVSGNGGHACAEINTLILSKSEPCLSLDALPEISASTGVPSSDPTGVMSEVLGSGLCASPFVFGRADAARLSPNALPNAFGPRLGPSHIAPHASTGAGWRATRLPHTGMNTAPRARGRGLAAKDAGPALVFLHCAQGLCVAGLSRFS